MWIGQCEKIYAWELLVASTISMKMFNHTLYIEISKHQIFYWTKNLMPRLQILVWHDFFQTQVPILVLSTLPRLGKYTTHVVIHDTYHMESIPSLILVIEHKYQSQQGYVYTIIFNIWIHLYTNIYVIYT
jgi:hypothetical protein